MKLFHVYKKNWCPDMENRGLIIRTTTWQRAKGIAMDYWKDQSKDNLFVKEHKIVDEGIVCPTDGDIWNNTNYN